MADERPFMPPPPNGLRNMPPRPPVFNGAQPTQNTQNTEVQRTEQVQQDQAQVVQNVADEEKIEKKTVKEKKVKDPNKNAGKKFLYVLGFLVFFAAAVGLVFLFVKSI